MKVVINDSLRGRIASRRRGELRASENIAWDIVLVAVNAHDRHDNDCTEQCDLLEHLDRAMR